MKKAANPFLLSKWYVDLIDSAGNLFIIYIGRIKFGRFNIYYSSLLSKPLHEKSTEIYSLKKYHPPEINEDTFCWYSDELGLKLKFSQSGYSVEKNLIEDPEEYIKWHCFQTRSEGEIIVNGNKYFSGYGYVEKLDMTIKPWMLPFNELRWGRFISDDGSVIWINYKGQMNCSLIMHGKEEYNDPLFFEDRIEFNYSSEIIRFISPEDIKKGEVISSTFSKIPLVSKIIPSGLINIFEHKSVSKAVLISNGKPKGKGWALYEVVGWF